MSFWKDLNKALSGAASVVSNAAGAANDSLNLLNNSIQDSLESQAYEREQNKILDKLEADVEFAKEYKRQIARLKMTGLSRAQIKVILDKNMPKNDDISVEELLKAE